MRSHREHHRACFAEVVAYGAGARFLAGRSARASTRYPQLTHPELGAFKCCRMTSQAAQM
jgi:hypothetical protein